MSLHLIRAWSPFGGHLGCHRAHLGSVRPLSPGSSALSVPSAFLAAWNFSTGCSVGSIPPVPTERETRGAGRTPGAALTQGASCTG